MDPRAVAEFVNRDWAAIASAKSAYWAERFQQDGWRPAWDAADALLVDVRRTQPDYPTERDRASDLDDHLKLLAVLARASHAIARR
jgi:hypothetical protein